MQMTRPMQRTRWPIRLARPEGAPRMLTTTLAVPADRASEKILRKAQVKFTKMIVGNEEGRSRRNMFILDPKDVLKVEKEGFLFEDRKPSSVEGVLRAILCNPVAPSKSVPKNLKTKEMQELRQSYLDLCLRRVQSNYNQHNQALEKSKVDITAASKAFVDATRRMEIAVELLSTARKMRDDSGEKFAREFEALMKIDKIERIEIRNDLVRVWTRTLYCTPPEGYENYDEDGEIDEEQYEYIIGKMMIELHLDHGYVTYRNRSRRIHGHHAPHVDEEGFPCEGNSAGIFKQLLAKFEISAAVQVAIQFIESVNPNGTFTDIEDWPRSRRSRREREAAKPRVQRSNK